MGIIGFKEANCKSCYKCIRNCELKAIKFGSDQAQIIDDSCILCGKCTLVCPQNAKKIKNSIPEIKKNIKDGKKIYASLAPSYVAAFPGKTFAMVSGMLKKLGFCHVEEAAVGAVKTSREFMKIADENKMDNIIMTCCHSVVLLIERYYPSLIPLLAPVKSPMSVHAGLMKTAYGSDIEVAFIGPCISKIEEAERYTETDHVILFDDIIQWMKEEGIWISGDSKILEDAEAVNISNAVSRIYPIPGGILKTISHESRTNYRTVAIDGMKRCLDALECLMTGGISGYILEMSTCSGSCLNGPGLTNRTHLPFLISRDRILTISSESGESESIKSEEQEIAYTVSYKASKVQEKVPTKEQIMDILESIGKSNVSSILNCGTCGYSTCWEKAVAVFQGKADLKMCLPYMREKSESVSNLILETTPNSIFVLDKNSNIIEFNIMARKKFDLKDVHVGLPYSIFLDSSAVDKVRKTGTAVFDIPTTEANGTLFIEQTVVPMSSGDLLVIAKDVTEIVENNKKNEAFRIEIIKNAQKIIDKQMRTAQEIASLLGETTGETKAVLNKIQKSIEQGDNL